MSGARETLGMPSPVIVRTLTHHRHNLACGHRTDSNNPRVEILPYEQNKT